MKRKIITSLFALCAIASQAQNTKNSSSAPLDSVIIEGVVTYMPDGARLNYLQEGVNAMQETIVKDGKFRIAISQKEKESVLHLIQFGPSLDIYTEIGKKIKVIGDDAHTVTYWHVESDNFNQKENNAYNLFIQEKLPEFYEADNKSRLAQSKLTEKSMSGTLTQEDQEKVIPELRALIQKVEALRKEKYNAAILDFMKDRPFSKRMIDELWGISISDHTPSIVEKAHEIFKKIPQEAMNEPQVVETKAKLNADRVQVGEQMKDFTLFDREGNKHQLSEFKGKYTILEFTYVGCVACQLVKPVLDDFYKRNKDKVEVVAIYYDTEKDWMAEGVKHKVSFHEWNDHARSAEPVAAYGVRAYPTFVIIDPNGKILDIKESASGFYEIIKKYIPDAEVEKKLENARNS